MEPPGETSRLGSRKEGDEAMSTEGIVARTESAENKWLYRVGGLSALAIAIGYIVIIPLFAHVGAPPHGGEAWMKYLQGKTDFWWAILQISVLTDVLFVPLGLSLYAALNHLGRNAMLAATAFMGMFVVLDLAVTWTNYGALLKLSAQYTSAAASDLQRASCVAAADYASAALASPTEVYYAIVDLSLGILIASLAMLKGRGIFGRTAACLGIATGLTGVAAPAGIFAIVMMNAIFATAWALFVGFGLLKLSRR